MAKHKRRVRRRQRERMPSTLRLGILITVLVFIVIASGILMIPALNVNDVYCEGCNNTNQTDIIMASRIEIGGNILLANVGRAEREIRKMPIVEEVTVKRVFPDKICIVVTERTPAAYVMKGGECAVIDKEGIVLEAINDARVAAIFKANTPPSYMQIEGNAGQEEKGEEEADEDKESLETTEDTDTSESSPKMYSIPLISGIELENMREGKEAKSTDDEKFEELLKICNALSNAELLNRATYIDINSMADVKIYIENRLEVQLGTIDNIGYRTKFLSEVINTKISAYERAIMDYRSDDIYVRSPEDGKARTVKEPEETESDDEETDDENEEAEEKEEDTGRSTANVTL